jgi:hypothetical protein
LHLGDGVDNSVTGSGLDIETAKEVGLVGMHPSCMPSKSDPLEVVMNGSSYSSDAACAVKFEVPA